MKTLTFAFDVQFNDKEDWIAEGTKVKVSDNPYYLNKFQDSIPVIINEAYTYEGEHFKLDDPVLEWFDKRSFVEFR